MDLAAAVLEAMRRYASRTAISFPGGEISYQRLEKDVREIEAFLRENNRGHKSVLLFMAQGPSLVASVLGCLWSQAVFCPVHWDTPEQRLVKILEELGTDLVFTEPEQEAFWRSLAWRQNLSLQIVCISTAQDKLKLTCSRPSAGQCGITTRALGMFIFLPALQVRRRASSAERTGCHILFPGKSASLALPPILW